MLLAEPKNSKLVKPNLKVEKVEKWNNTIDDKNVYFIHMSSQSIAPFVLLDFTLGSGIRGQFVENGFFVFEGQKTIEFRSDLDLKIEQIIDNLVIKTVTDVI